MKAAEDVALGLRTWAQKLALAVLALSCLAMRVAPPHLYGRVVIDNSSTQAHVPPAVFDHWRHRARYTCRLCHVEIGFAMSAEATQISAATNQSGFHCGACHDGKTKFSGKPVFASCADPQTFEQSASCRRCHMRGEPASLLADYEAFAAGLPRDRYGGVDWEKAEAARLVKPLDLLEGTNPRAPMKMEKEASIEAKGNWMAGVKFSHRKHTLWLGCEVCHPEIFPSAKGGSVKFTMLQISNGQSCGVCHDKVAFPLAECARCHVNTVR